MSRSENNSTAAAAPGGSRWYSECSLERRVQDFSANPAAASEALRSELLRDLVGLADREESEWIAGRFGDDYGAWLCAFDDFRDGYFLSPEYRGRLEELEDELDCLEAYFLSFSEVDSNDVVRDAARAHLDLVAGDARGKIEMSRREIERFAGGALDERTAWLLKTQMFRDLIDHNAKRSVDKVSRNITLHEIIKIHKNSVNKMASALHSLADVAYPLYGDEKIDGAFELEQPGGTLDTAAVTKVHRPWLFGFRPVKTDNGRAVLVLGGGGYVQLMVGREGVAVARWLASLGFHAFVLVHRFPTAETGPQAPLDDARRALGLIEERVGAPNGIGVCGLSSGGHLGAALLAEYPAVWTSSVPSPPKLKFAIIGYGPISTNAAGRTIVPNKAPLAPPEKQTLYDVVQPDTQLGPSCPPTFIVYSGNDPIVPVVNAYRLAEGIGKAGGAVELHVFADAPHGFALDTKDLPVSKWPVLCEAWLAQNGLLS